MSAQITFGYVSYYGPPPYGVTLGARTYRIRQDEWKKFVYTDFQIWPFLGGIGVGKMIDIYDGKYLNGDFGKSGDGGPLFF